jgi:hypothetical protein
MLRSRGQALVETAIALPVFLLAMFGIVWALQTGVLGERVELVARYGGMVSAEISPYTQYSLYAAYSAASGSPLATPCATPPPALLSGGAPLQSPATQTLPFWQPSTGSSSTSVTCGKTSESGGGLSAPMLLGRAAISVSTSSDVPAMLPGSGGQTVRNAALTAFTSPDMATLIACYPELQSAFERSVNPQTDPSPPNAPAPIGIPVTGALSLSGC